MNSCVEIMEKECVRGYGKRGRLWGPGRGGRKKWEREMGKRESGDAPV